MSTAARLAVCGAVAAASALVITGCSFIPAPPPPPSTSDIAMPASSPTPTPEAGLVGVPLCPDAIADHHAEVLTGRPTAEGMRPRRADHPLPLPLDGATVHCATTVDGPAGTAVYTLVVLTGEGVPAAVRGAAGELEVIEDQTAEGGGLRMAPSDFMSAVSLAPASPATLAAVELATGHVWLMEAVVFTP